MNCKRGRICQDFKLIVKKTVVAFNEIDTDNIPG